MKNLSSLIYRSKAAGLVLVGSLCLVGGACKTTERPAATSSTSAPTSKPAATAKAMMASSPAEVEARVMADLRFLADDNMLGRYTGTPENERAAAYIAGVFAKAGAKSVAGASTMLTPVRLIDQAPVTSASVSFGESLLSFPEAVLPLSREAANVKGKAIYLDHAGLEVAQAAEVRGKVVITESGSTQENADPRAWLELAKTKRERLQDMGALALVEIYRSSAMPFSRIVGGVNRGGMRLAPKASTAMIPLLWITENDALASFRKAKTAVQMPVTIAIEGVELKTIKSDNVIAVLPGTDPALATEYIAVTAHFDHIGITARPGQTDSINNGARDNGMGTVALLEVARAFAANPGKRPLLLMGWTAEEVGLLGSRYWAENPTVPLDQIVFNFNMDGAGYDDTTAVTMNGYGRSTAQALIDAAVKATGLSPKPDPVPQYNLFQQSDNYSLAAVGIPAINMAPGFTGFSEELMKYYHQPADHVDQVDAGYLRRYTQAAVAAVMALSNASERPTWVIGDEFAPVAAELYKK